MQAVVAVWTVAGLAVAVRPYWGPGDGVPALSIPGRAPGVVCQGQLENTEHKHCAPQAVAYLKGTQN